MVEKGQALWFPPSRERGKASINTTDQKAHIRACTLSRFSCVWLSAIPWTIIRQAPQSMGFPRQECWRGLLFPSPEKSSWPRDWIHVSYVSCIGRWILYHQRHPGSPLKHKASSCPHTQETGSPRASRGESSRLHGDQVMKEGPSKEKTMLPTQRMTQGHRCVRSQCLKPLRNHVTPTQTEGRD